MFHVVAGFIVKLFLEVLSAFVEERAGFVLGLFGLYLLIVRGEETAGFFEGKALSLVFDDFFQLEEELDTEKDQQYKDAGIGHDGRQKLVDYWTHQRAVENIGDDNCDYIVVDQAGVSGGVPAHDETDEIVKGGAEDEGVGEGGGCGLGVVEGVH